jgi:hypothetical protein
VEAPVVVPVAAGLKRAQLEHGPYAYEDLTPGDIERLNAEGIPRCFSKERARRNEQESCLPLRIGHDSRVNSDVILFRHCPDICPEFTIISVYEPKPSLVTCCRRYARQDGRRRFIRILLADGVISCAATSCIQETRGDPLCRVCTGSDPHRPAPVFGTGIETTIQVDVSIDPG